MSYETKIYLLTLLLLPALGTVQTGCDSDSPPDGSAVISWRVGGSGAGSGCEAAEIGLVEVELIHRGEIYDVASGDCDSQRIQFERVRPGKYDVRVLGYPLAQAAKSRQRDPAEATFEGFFKGLEVRSNREAAPQEILLSARQGSIYVNWTFENGLMCASNGIDDVEILVFDMRGNKIYERTVRCDLSDYRDELPPAEQAGPLRGVLIEGLYAEPLTVEVAGIDGAGIGAWLGVESFDLSRGEVRDVLVTLEER